MALWLYLKALGRHWWSLLSCAVFTIIGVTAALENWSNGWIARVSVGAAVILFLVASALAWTDEHRAAQAEKAKNEEAPKMDIAVLNVVSKGEIGSGLTDLFLYLELVLQSPSRVSILDFSLMVFSDSNSMTLPGSEDILDWRLEKWAVDNSLSFAACAPLVKELARRGDPVQGWIHFPIPSLSEKIMRTAGLKVKLNCEHGTCYFRLDGGDIHPSGDKQCMVKIPKS